MFRWHCTIIALLVVTDLVFTFLDQNAGHATVLGLHQVFDLVEETSIPNCFSAAALFATALIAIAVSRASQLRKGALTAGWRAVAVTLMFLAFDEGAGLHDRLAFSGQQLISSHGVFFIGWILPYCLLLAVAATVFIPFAIRLPAETRRRLVVAGAIYIVAAMGFEMLEALMMDEAAAGGSLAAVDLATLNRTWSMSLLVAVEEGGEMLGAALAARALLMHLVGVQHTRLLRFQRSPGHEVAPAALSVLNA